MVFIITAASIIVKHYIDTLKFCLVHYIVIISYTYIAIDIVIEVAKFELDEDDTYCSYNINSKLITSL